MITNDGVNLDLAQEAATGLRKAEEEQTGGNSNSDVDAVLNRREDGDNHTCEEDENFEGRDSPELVDGVGSEDEITDGVDDDCGENGVGDPEEDCRKSVDCKEDDNRSNDTGKGGTHTSLGLDGSTREGTGRGVGAEEGAEQVGDTDGEELLGGVDDIVVDTAERLGNCNVLDQQDDDGGGKFASKCLDDGDVDWGCASIGEATGDRAENCPPGRLGSLGSVDLGRLAGLGGP